MGRRKIPIQPLIHERNRTVTLQKRRSGIFKKAYELGVLCSVDVAILIFNRQPGYSEKLYQYSSSDIHGILNRYYEHAGPKETRGPSDFSSEINDNDEGDDAEEANTEFNTCDSAALHESSVMIGCKRVREVELIDLDALPPVDNPSSKEVMTSDGSPRLQQSTSYAPSNKKPRLSVSSPPPRDGTFRSDHQSVFFTHTSSSRHIPGPSLQSAAGYSRNERGFDVDYHSPLSSSSSLPKALQFPSPHPSSPTSPTQPSPYRPYNYPLLYPPSPEPSTPSASPRPTFRSPSSSDPSSCDTPPTYQGFSNLDSHNSPGALTSIYNGTVPLASSCPPGDQDIMFDAFMEAIEQDKAKAPMAHATQAQVGLPEGNSQFRARASHHDTSPDLASNAHNPGSADWFQVLSQNAHLVNLNLKPDSENLGPGFGFSEPHGPSIFYKPARLFDVNASPGRHPPFLSSSFGA